MGNVLWEMFYVKKNVHSGKELKAIKNEYNGHWWEKRVISFPPPYLFLPADYRYMGYWKY